MAQLAIVQRVHHSEDLTPGEGQALRGFLLTFKVTSYEKRISSATRQDVSVHWETKAQVAGLGLTEGLSWSPLPGPSAPSTWAYGNQTPTGGSKNYQLPKVPCG